MVTRVGHRASSVAIAAGALGVGLWLVQLVVGLPHWLWLARLVAFAITAAAFALTWAVILVQRRGH